MRLEPRAGGELEYGVAVPYQPIVVEYYPICFIVCTNQVGERGIIAAGF